MISLNRTSPHPIGLHLGPRLVRLVQLGARAGSHGIQAMAEAELPADNGSSPEARDRETASIIRRVVGDHGFRGRQVVSCVGAQELFVQNVRLPQLSPEEITSALKWEAAERLPYPVEDAELRHIFAGPLRQDGNVKQEVILLACQRSIVERQVKILELAGLSPLAIDLEPCAILRAMLPANLASGVGSRLAFLNFGEAATTVVIADGDQMLFLKSIDGGGEHFDRAVAKQLDLPLKEAARMRGTVTAAETLDPANDVHRSVIDAIRSTLENICADIELCLRYFKVTFRGKSLDRMILTGSEASSWLAEFLANRLSTPCSIGNSLANSNERVATNGVAGKPSPAALAGRWTTPLGLALR